MLRQQTHPDKFPLTCSSVGQGHAYVRVCEFKCPMQQNLNHPIKEGFNLCESLQANQQYKEQSKPWIYYQTPSIIVQLKREYLLISGNRKTENLIISNTSPRERKYVRIKNRSSVQLASKCLVSWTSCHQNGWTIMQILLVKMCSVSYCCLHMDSVKSPFNYKKYCQSGENSSSDEILGYILFCGSPSTR